MTIPDDCRSGPYALHVRCGESDKTATREAYIAFFVRPPRDPGGARQPPARCVAGADLSYLAYANHAEHITARGASCRWDGCSLSAMPISTCMTIPSSAARSTTRHADGSGVDYSSRLRPNPQLLAAQYHSWLGGHGSALYQYNADTHLFDWLEQQGVDYDVITDEDLHEEGFELSRTTASS